MNVWSALGCALSGLAAWAPAQRFGFTHQMFPAHDDASQAIALGDLDGDGDFDAFVANSAFPYSGEQNRLYFNDGAGVFADVTASNLPPLLDNSKAVALGDVDGDGDLDAFVGNLPMAGNCSIAQDRLYLNAGGGIFTDVTSTNLPPLLDTTHAVALGDLDGDGDLDAFVGIAASGTVCTPAQNRLYLNSGTGVFTDVTGSNFPAVLDDTRAIALGDVDGDGDLDVFVGNFGQSRLHFNDGLGTFTDVTSSNLPVLSNNTTAVALGDVDGDGDLDSYLGNGGNPGWQNRLYLNSGTGLFTDVTGTNLPAMTDKTNGVTLGDVDGDGDLDALVANTGSAFGGQNRLHLNGGTGDFTDATATHLPALLDDSTAVALADVDGDGDLDALLSNNGFPASVEGQNRLYLNPGTGIYTDATSWNLPALLDITTAVAVGDMDGDEDLDAFVGNAAHPGLPVGQNRLYRNGGAGFFTDVGTTNLPLLTDDTRAVALGDVDGDGDLDAYIGNLGQSRLLLNGGTGTFTDATASSLPTLVENTTALALGDVDGDGDLDALVGNLGQQNRLYLNGGAGAFRDFTATHLPALADPTNAVALGDVDGDGDLDALVGNGSYPFPPLGHPNRLYLNGGTGVFTDVTASHLPALLDITTSVALGDVDGDGDLDALVGNLGQQNRLYLNGGNGIFADATATNLPALLDDTRAVALGDVDGDGDLDALIGNHLPGNRLYLNDGAGVFTDATATDLPDGILRTVALALGDVDGDGDLDGIAGRSGLPLFASGGEVRLYTNLTRQLAWRGIPRAGKPLDLDLRGPGNGVWVLAAALGSANIPLPPFGTLRLDPTTLILVGGGTLDPQGRATLSYSVPPSALGLSIYWQGAVAGPPVLTNLEVTTIVNL